MEVAIILSEGLHRREGHKVALELEERLLEAGVKVSLCDLADLPFYLLDTAYLEPFSEKDAIILVGEVEKPVYPVSFHYMLAYHTQIWKNKMVGTVMVSRNRPMANIADYQLRRVLETLNARVPDSRLHLSRIEHKFSPSLSVADAQLDDEIHEYIQSFLTFPEKNREAFINIDEHLS